MNITLDEDFAGFYDFIFENIDLESYQYRFLKSYLDKVLNKEYESKKSSILNVTDSSWLLILYGDVFYVYGKNWTNEQIVEISKKFQFSTAEKSIIAGNAALVEDLLQFFQLKYSVVKRRIFYKAESIEKINLQNTVIRPALMEELNEIANMFQDYYEDEYHGKNNKNFVDMQHLAYSYIQTKDLYILLDGNGVIMSFCTILDPDIGILFTKRNYRGKGFAKCLLSFCSSLLLERNRNVFLMTDQDVIDSNKVCISLGYEPVFYYKSIETNV